MVTNGEITATTDGESHQDVAVGELDRIVHVQVGAVLPERRQD